MVLLALVRELRMDVFELLSIVSAVTVKDGSLKEDAVRV
jgi:hypothetical protein